MSYVIGGFEIGLEDFGPVDRLALHCGESSLGCATLAPPVFTIQRLQARRRSFFIALVAKIVEIRKSGTAKAGARGF
jgi:hypothetical protein